MRGHGEYNNTGNVKIKQLLSCYERTALRAARDSSIFFALIFLIWIEIFAMRVYNIQIRILNNIFQ